MYSKWQIGRQIFKKDLDIKRRASICADQMACKTVWQIVYSAVSIPFSHFSPPIIFYSLQSNLSAEKEYFSMQILNKSIHYIVQRHI